MKFSVCIDLMFSNLEFDKRFKAVKDCGIHTVEFWKWSPKNIETVKALLNENNLNLSACCLDSRDEALSTAISRGLLNLESGEPLLKAITESIPICRTLGTNALIAVIGLSIDELTYDEQLTNIYNNLMFVKELLEKENITLLVEPINPKERPTYFLPYAGPMFEILRRINSPNIKMLYDIYHQSMTGDFSLDEVLENIKYIGHFHVADCPGRHEPGTGDVDYNRILTAIDKAGYPGYIGLEYRATMDDAVALNWIKNIPDNYRN